MIFVARVVVSITANDVPNSYGIGTYMKIWLVYFHAFENNQSTIVDKI